MEEKACIKCGVVKPLSEYHINNKASDKHSGTCKACARIIIKKYREENKDKIRETTRKYYNKNRDHLIEYTKQWMIDNPEKVIEKNKRRYSPENREQNILRVKKYYQEHKEEILAKDKTRKQKNKEKLSKQHKEYLKKNKDILNAKKRERYKKDKLVVLKNRINGAIRRGVKRIGKIKSKFTIDVLGCSIEFFKEYIEAKFIEGMTWDNFGQWELDHIIPLASARTEEDVYKLSYYTNFQPLWKEENMKKYDKIPEIVQFKLM